MKRPSGNQLAIVITLVCAGFIYQFLFKPFYIGMQNMPTSRDANQASSLSRYVVSKVAFDEKSLENSNEPPVYVRPGRNTARLEVYGVMNSNCQEHILSAVKDWQTTNQNMAKLSVRFYEREKPRVEHGQLIEPLFRETFIVLSNQQSDIILNPVAPKN